MNNVIKCKVCQCQQNKLINGNVITQRSKNLSNFDIDMNLY